MFSQLARLTRTVGAHHRVLPLIKQTNVSLRTLSFSSSNNNNNNFATTSRRHFSDDALEKQFQAAVSNLQKVTADVENDKKLQLYALFKQASNGPCTGEKPSVFNVVEKAKWAAWKGLGDISKDEAKKRYIDTVGELLAASGSATDVNTEPEMLFEKRDQVYWIRLNRDQKLNAITPETYLGFIDSLKSAAEDPDIKFVVVTANGRYFSAGNDLSKSQVCFR